MIPVKLCILWHQHQPSYRAGNRFRMPWAWLHATKDYLEMAEHLDAHPKMKAAVNLVPSLLEQIEAYLTGEATDPVLDMMTRDADRLTEADKEWMIDNFFRAAPGVVRSSVRYAELFNAAFDEHESRKSVAWTSSDYRDLAVHYSLAWTGAIARQREPFSSFLQQDRNFTEADKQRLQQAQWQNVRNIIPLHQTLSRRGQVELTTTPFYHPILPLLADTNSALEATPGITLPRLGFHAPEEASGQLQSGRLYFEKQMDVRPDGLWPSEGSISQEVLTLIRQHHFLWTASDEGVLKNTIGNRPILFLGKTIRPAHAKYFPWLAETPAGPLAVFFRDHQLADDIGFVYQSWEPEKAVAHFVENILRIRGELTEAYGEEILEQACISVILDGENCWEYYPNNGYEFLDQLYAALSGHEAISPERFIDVLPNTPERHLPELPPIVAGSWINANFGIWTGHPEDNLAWDMLAEAYAAYTAASAWAKQHSGRQREDAQARLERAHHELAIAEGSDWCWWYGDDHVSDQSAIFDELFRMHLRAVYVHLDLTVPAALMTSIPEHIRRRSEIAGIERREGHAIQPVYGAMHRVDT